ncbi:sugar ABC transporter permease [Treponema sp. OttesenSCG-928-L16]|nr:sugar ABC transporter permease [Treponema sp. OttesenSCG-928-L16]
MKSRTSYFTKRQSRDTRDGILFLLPAMIAYIAFIGIPIVMAIGLMFMNYNLLSAPSFVGLNNIKRLFIDPQFTQVLGNTFKYFFLLTPIHCIYALVWAYLVSQIRFNSVRNIIRNVTYFPVIVTTASVAVVWRYMFATDTGFINFFLRNLGFNNVPWMTNPVMIYVTIALFSWWKFLGTTFLYYFVGLQNIPATYLEAARIDGANRFQTFFKVTLPLLSPTIFFVFITNMIGVFQIFDEPFFLATDNPVARSLSLHIYLNAFVNIRIGYASVLAMIMLLIILTITGIQFAVQKRWVNYDYE